MHSLLLPITVISVRMLLIRTEITVGARSAQGFGNTGTNKIIRFPHFESDF
jgi:hypothetical protein